MQKTIRLMPVLMALAIVVGACVPQQAPTTQSPQETEVSAQVGTSVAMTMEAQGQIATFVVQTVNAQNAGTAAAQPQFTQTPLLVPTSISILPTVTPFVISGGGGGGGGSGGGGGGSNPTKERLSCAVVQQIPEDGTHMHAAKEIDVIWVLKNTGTKKWLPAWTFVFKDGTNFATSAGYALGKEVKPGETFRFELDAIVPPGGNAEHPKQVTMRWNLEAVGETEFCRPYVSIFVP
jgi:hypothetical protein